MSIGRALRPAVLAASVLLSLSIVTGCVADDPGEPGESVLRVSLAGCGAGIGSRATAVSIGDGLALTVAHGFDEVDGATVADTDGAETAVELVFVDRERDLALISFDPAALSDQVAVGLEIHADDDDPADHADLVVDRDGQRETRRVELLRRTPVTLDGEGRRAGIEVAAAIEPGDSGAPLLDDDDRIIGLMFASSRTSETGWATAASEFETIADHAGAPIPLSC